MSVGLLREFYLAIHDLWRQQHALGMAVSDKAPPDVKAVLDQRVAAAMRRVERVDNLLMGR
jgi:hypothetical protein